jgi:glutathione S-transferase
MKSIRLYQIPFSNFCDKVRWTLDFHSIPYETINYVGRQTPGFKKAPRTIQKLTPIIEDPNNNSLFISDSTPILLYLDQHYGNNKTLFPTNKKDDIIQYCLKLDSQLGLYARRLAYLYIISRNPAILSVFIDRKYDKISCDDWKSYFLGLAGSCILIGRLGVHQIKEENIFEKTVCVLEEIKQNIDGKKYLFNNEFTAADLTLTSLIQLLKFIKPLFIKYKPILEYCDRIRENHDPKKYNEPNIQRLFDSQHQKRQSTSRKIISSSSNIVFYPLHYLFTDDGAKKPLLQYPSPDIQKKAHNDARVLGFNSKINTAVFFMKYFWHLCFTLPQQMEFVNNEGKKILQK